MIDQLIADGRLKSFSYDSGKEVILDKPAPSWHIVFEVIDKKKRAQKKKSKIIKIDRTVPQDKLNEVAVEIRTHIYDLLEKEYGNRPQ